MDNTKLESLMDMMESVIGLGRDYRDCECDGLRVFKDRVGGMDVSCEICPGKDGATSHVIYLSWNDSMRIKLRESCGLSGYMASGERAEMCEELMTRIGESLADLKQIEASLHAMSEYVAQTMLGQSGLAKAIDDDIRGGREE